MAQLIHSAYFNLFLIITLGFLLGKIKVKGISLDVSAVIFIALFFGYLGITIPEDFQHIGLILFIFTIGIQAGPGFFQSFKKHGAQLIYLVLILIGSATALTALLAYGFNIDKKVAIGLFTGALTSTPGLAAAIDATHSPLASIGYGIAYPFGVIGVILFVRLLPKTTGVNLSAAEKEIKQETLSEYPDVISRNFIVGNSNIIGKSIGELSVRAMTGASISRVMHGDMAVTPSTGTILYEGDLIKAVGTANALEKVRLLIGSETDQEVPLGKDYDVQSVLVTNRRIVNKTLGQLNLLRNFNATVTRIRRSSVSITPSPSVHVRFGDKFMIACDRENMKEVIRLLGNDNKRLSDTDFFPIAFGIVLGVLVGKINITFSDAFSFSPGLTGGVLAVALILSNIGKTGPVIWTMTGAANQLLRQLGLLLFLAAVGTSAGAHLVETYAQYGIKLFIIGAVITLVPMIICTLFARKIFGVNMLNLLGTLTGGMTSTPGLAAVTPMTDSNAPQIAYATVYPVAMVFLIICVQLLTLL